MVVVFLDDNPNRTKLFRSQHPYADTCETSQACIGLLSKYMERNEDITYLFLDHDLGGEIHVDSSREDTGMEVVRWMQENTPAVGTVVVHSHNQPAAANMVSKLHSAGYHVVGLPFGFLFSSYRGL